MSSILVVDDERSATRVLRVQLENAGYEVMTASNGEEAMERLRKRSVDVLVTDLNMPRMAGRDLCESVHREMPDCEPLIFVLTARPGAENRQWTSDIPNVEFVEKPASLRRLIQRIGKRLAESRAVDGDAPV